MSQLTIITRCHHARQLDHLQPWLKCESIGGAIAIVPPDAKPSVKGVELIPTHHPDGGEALERALERVQTDFALIVDGDVEVDLQPGALATLTDTAAHSGAAIVYADYSVIDGQQVTPHPLIDYQPGSIRDDFDFGPMRLVACEAVREVRATFGPLDPTRHSGDYDLRMRLASRYPILHLAGPLYTVRHLAELDEDDHFAYVDPRNADVQRVREQIATGYLKRVGAYLAPAFEPVPSPEADFPVLASVVIPVRNRKKTIGDAVHSVLSQETGFDFNLIVVDNHSTEGTTTILSDIAKQDRRLVHLVPDRHDLGIGGCWNQAVFSSSCGRYAIQLDSDDIYADAHTLSTMVEAMRAGPYAMVVGSYRVVDFDLNELPPGVVDHREWTRENGRNNVLRVNGFGAPRGFDVNVLRRHPFPNVSYGEDYAVGLRISRQYEVGRLYEPIYLCRRWEENSDASLPIDTLNRYNTYKDGLRTHEILARRQMNGVAPRHGLPGRD